MPANLPFDEAIQSQQARRILPTDLRSDMLQRIPAQVRAHARFSAAMVHGGYLVDIDRTLQAVLRGEMDTATALRELDQSLEALGYDRQPGRGPLTEHRSYSRRKLILDTTTAQAGNYGQWIQGQTEVARKLYPAYEFYRATNAREPRDWESRWLAGGARLYGGRMIALKDDPIWTNPTFNRLGTPYPPFDWGSGMRMRQIDRDECIELGLIKPDQQVAATNAEFKAESRAAANWPERMQRALTSTLGDIAEFSGGVFRMKGPTA